MDRKPGRGNLDTLMYVAAIVAVLGAVTMLVAGAFSSKSRKHAQEVDERIERLSPSPRAETAAALGQLEELEEQVDSIRRLYAADSEVWRTELDKHDQQIRRLQEQLAILENKPQQAFSPIKFQPLEIKPLRVNLVHYQGAKAKKKPIEKKPEAKP